MQIASPKDETFILLKQIQLHYKSSIIANRFALGTKLPLLVQQIGFDDSVSAMAPIISYLANDNEHHIRYDCGFWIIK